MTDHKPWSQIGPRNSNPNAVLAKAAADEMRSNDSCTQLSLGSDDDDDYNDNKKQSIPPPPSNYYDRSRDGRNDSRSNHQGRNGGQYGARGGRSGRGGGGRYGSEPPRQHHQRYDTHDNNGGCEPWNGDRSPHGGYNGNDYSPPIGEIFAPKTMMATKILIYHDNRTPISRTIVDNFVRGREKMKAYLYCAAYRLQKYFPRTVVRMGMSEIGHRLRHLSIDALINIIDAEVTMRQIKVQVINRRGPVNYNNRWFHDPVISWQSLYRPQDYTAWETTPRDQRLCL
jgi:hypothetical protein